MGTPFSTPQIEESRGPLVPALIAGGAIAIVILVVVLLTRTNPQNTGPAPEDPYASNIKVMDLHLSHAENFAGASVMYLEGQIANMGSKRVTGATVEAVFRNSLGEVVDRQTQQLTLTQERPGYNDAISLKEHPLGANAQHEFRLTFEHVSADWNQGLPELRFIKIATE
jgi:hypothetical protein